MIPETFDYSCPATLDEAIKLSQEYGEDAKYMSGGHSLIPMMKLRFATPSHVIDISRLSDLDYIKEEDGKLKIGALATEADLEHSELVKSNYPILVDATKLIADPSVRNKATIGGNIAHGDAANDHPAVMLALRASVVATGPNGSREIPIDEFFHGFYMTALEPHEVLTEINMPASKPGSGNAYHKIERKVGNYASSGAAVHIEIDGDDVVQEVGIGLTNVNPTPLRVQRAEDLLRGQKLTDDLISEAGKIASEDCSPSEDLRGSEAYKRSITKTLVIRMLNESLARARASL